jgi:hypothetical protein
MILGADISINAALNMAKGYNYGKEEGSYDATTAKPKESKPQPKSSNDGLKYSPTKKHQKGGHGTKMNLDDETAQGVLNSSDLIGKRRYGLYNKQVYEFKSDNVGGWHGYPIDGDKAPPGFLRKFLNQGEISKSTYKKLINGKL